MTPQSRRYGAAEDHRRSLMPIARDETRDPLFWIASFVVMTCLVGALLS